jgi:hypothetical protein
MRKILPFRMTDHRRWNAFCFANSCCKWYSHVRPPPYGTKVDSPPAQGMEDNKDVTAWALVGMGCVTT